MVEGEIPGAHLFQLSAKYRPKATGEMGHGPSHPILHRPGRPNSGHLSSNYNISNTYKALTVGHGTLYMYYIIFSSQ